MLTVIYWRDIPAQVVEGQGRKATREMLPSRFQDAIDRAATRAGLIGSDAYMAEWRKVEVDGADADTLARQLDEEHPATVLEGLVVNQGMKG